MALMVITKTISRTSTDLYQIKTMALTKQQALRVFKKFYPISKTDSIMNQLEWSYYTDSLSKDGRITLKQYENWSNPF